MPYKKTDLHKYYRIGTEINNRYNNYSHVVN